MTELVWISDWEIQCCGEEFAVGDEVRWPLVPVADDPWDATLGDELAAELAWSYEGHEDPPVPERRVTVRGIRTVSCRYAPEPPPADQRQLHVVAGSTVMEPVDAIDQWYAPDGDLRLCGWLVDADLG